MHSYMLSGYILGCSVTMWGSRAGGTYTWNCSSLQRSLVLANPTQLYSKVMKTQASSSPLRDPQVTRIDSPLGSVMVWSWVQVLIIVLALKLESVLPLPQMMPMRIALPSADEATS